MTESRDKQRETKPGRKYRRWKEQAERYKTETERKIGEIEKTEMEGETR